MKILLTLDYELFLGEKTGTTDNCLFNPMKKLLEEVLRSNAKFSIFVDAAYLFMLNELSAKYSMLARDLQKITAHLNFLKDQGHDLQLHIHPQWYFSKFDGQEWLLDKEHYKMCDVDQKQMEALFVQSKRFLDGLIGKSTIAFRAGGFSAQPTETLSNLFKVSGIKIDSSVCPGTFYDSNCQKYDYTNAPKKSIYRFSEDICKESINGEFVEVPISMIKVSPVFHWKLAFTKLSVKFGGGKLYRRMGDGLTVKTTGSSIMTRMTRTVHTMATIDEYKASLLKNAYKKAKHNGNEYFCILGHPKLATLYSVKKLGEFCEFVKENGDEFITISQCYK